MGFHFIVPQNLKTNYPGSVLFSVGKEEVCHVHFIYIFIRLPYLFFFYLLPHHFADWWFILFLWIVLTLIDLDFCLLCCYFTFHESEISLYSLFSILSLLLSCKLLFLFLFFSVKPICSIKSMSSLTYISSFFVDSLLVLITQSFILFYWYSTQLSILAMAAFWYFRSDLVDR